MSRLKIVYILSLVALVALIGFTVFKPIAQDVKYSEVQREQLLETEDGWIIQFDIINHEGKDTEYTISVLVNDKPSTLTVSVKDEKAFTYIKHINSNKLTEGKVSFMVYKDGGTVPFEEGTYYLKKSESNNQ